MASLNQLFDLPEQICYVQCGFCTTILLVSVPSSSLTMVVTVRCGHCASLLSVNMMKKDEGNLEEDISRKPMDTRSSSAVTSSDNEEDGCLVNRVINKPPEKRQRAPSAYNRFIKEEIRRLKAENPSMAHKEAFSTAAKNWAHFPPIHYQEDEETLVHDEEVPDWSFEATTEVNSEDKDGFPERRSKRAKKPFEGK